MKLYYEILTRIFYKKIFLLINIIGSLSTIDCGIFNLQKSLMLDKKIQISLCQIIYKKQHYVKQLKRYKFLNTLQIKYEVKFKI